MDVSRRQQQDERPAFAIADGVELGVAAAFGAADEPRPPFSAARAAVDLDAGGIDEQPVRCILGARQRTEYPIPDTAPAQRTKRL